MSGPHYPLDHQPSSSVPLSTRIDVQMDRVERLSTKAESRDYDVGRASEVTLPVGDGPLDLEKILRYAVRKRGEAHIQPRELGVAFRDLCVRGIAASNSYQPTLGSMLNPLNILDAVQNFRHPPINTILKDFEGVVRPGQMLLVLGRPGSGCSTLLKTLTNLRHEYRSVSGTVHYDSLSPSDIERHFRGDVQYCPEDDVHFPTLTVEQTLSFAAKTRVPHERTKHTRTEYVNRTTDVLTSIFGLRHAKNTPIGDSAIRGISGGEKKRVSIAESLATRSCIGAWDNSTRGLDSSTALEFVRALRSATDTFNLTTIVSIYQAGESLYELFDKVCVINEGQLAYFGPINQARQYFIDMGYEPANRQTTADFLVAVTDPNARTPRPDLSGVGKAAFLPCTADDFAAYFKKSALGEAHRRDVDAYLMDFVGKPKRASAYIESARAEKANNMSKASPYTISIAMQARAVMLRRVQILRGNTLATGMNVFAFVFQAIVVGSIFLKAPEATSAYFSRGGVIFFALLFAALTNMAEIPALYSQRPIVHRHHNAALYHPFVEAIALTLVDVPVTFLTTLVYGIILYFMVGLQKSAGQFLVFYLFLFTMCMTMKAWFRAIAAAFKSEATATAVAGISVLGLSIYTGFSIPKPSMVAALRWITYLNPLTYGFEAVLTNEFRTLKGACSNLIPQGPGYENASLVNQVCATVGSVPGQFLVDGNRFVELSYGFSYSHTWKNFGIVVVFTMIFVIALLVFTEFNTSMANESSVVLFKRGSGSVSATSSNKADEESNQQNDEKIPVPEQECSKIDQGASARPEEMTDVFSWQHVNYTVPIHGGEERQLLSDISGFVAPGKLTALMGESGAGKTTLLNVLAQRVGTGVVTGDMFVNGQALPTDFQSQTGYCQQMDTHLPTATVREALLFSAKLRQPASVPLPEKEAYVEKCLEMCGLEAYGDAIVGSLGVEHRKRTTIAVELAAKPKLLLFLDEPTSGLDSQSAWSIIAFLRSLADHGQAILCTIHQPSAELFQVFDRLLLLQKGGRTVYFGDLGCNATTLIDYFERHGSRPCLATENPAEFMLDVIGAGATSTSKQNWNQFWLDSEECQNLQKEVDRIHSEGRSRPAVEVTFRTEFATPWMAQTRELYKRNAQAYWRDPTYLMAKLFLNIVGGLFIGLTFFKSKDTQQGTQNKLFAIFMTTVLSAPLSNQLQVPFIATRSIYMIRERPSRMYSWTALVTSQFLVELPWNILGSNLLFFCWYWTVGFDSSRAGYTYLMLALIYPAYYTSFGQAVAAMVPSAEIGALLFSLLFSFATMFDGVLQPFRELGWWTWMYRLSPYTYLIEGLLGQLVGRTEMHCSPVEFLTLNPPLGQMCGQYMDKFISEAGGYLTNPDASLACRFCSVKSSDKFLAESVNIFYDHHWRNFGFMIVYIAFNICCLFFFTYMFRIRTGSLLPSFKQRK